MHLETLEDRRNFSDMCGTRDVLFSLKSTFLVGLTKCYMVYVKMVQRDILPTQIGLHVVTLGS